MHVLLLLGLFHPLTVISQVNAHDEDEPRTPTARTPGPTDAVPDSPPPSFHSRASSITSQGRNGRVDAALADAFDTEGDDSDDEPDDRQRLVRGNWLPASTDSARAGDTASSDTPADSRTTQPSQPTAQVAPYRVYGGGIQSDGVFSNLAAKPEAGGAEKEEQPPVCHSQLFLMFPRTPCMRDQSANIYHRHTSRQQRTKHPPTGRRPSSHPASPARTRCTSTACRSDPFSASSGTA